MSEKWKHKMVEHKRKAHPVNHQFQEDANEREIMSENRKQMISQLCLLRTEIVDIDNLLTRVKDGDEKLSDKADYIQKKCDSVSLNIQYIL